MVLFNRMTYFHAMQVNKFYKKKRKLQTGMLILGLGFLSFPLFGLLGIIIHPALFFLFYLLIIFGFFKIFLNRAYLGKENSRFAIGALVLFILSWMQWLFMLGDIVMTQFILGFFFLFQSLAFFMILLIPVKNGLSLKIGVLFMILGSVVVFLNYLCVILSAVILFPIGFMVMGILSVVTYYRIRRGDYDPVMVVEGAEDEEIEGSVEKKKVIQRFIMYDGSLRTIKHNYRFRRNMGRSITATFAI